MTAMLVALALSSAHAEAPLVIEVEDGVSHVELTCGDKKMREQVRNNQATFPIAPQECTVVLVKPSGSTRYNGTWKCNEKGCELAVPPHKPISNAEGRVNFVLLEGVRAAQLEMVCPNGYRSRATVEEHTAVFDGVPAETCVVHFKGGQPAKFPNAQPGNSYRCSVLGTTAICSPYDL